VLLDANVLVYAVNRRAERHDAAARWLGEQLGGARRVGFPWQTIAAFLRVVSHPRLFDRPLQPAVAWDQVTEWLAAPVAWIPEPGPEYPRILGALLTGYDLRGNLVPDAALASLAIEHGVPLISSDTDFARFRELRWENPLG
jgi:hypothetical protein